MGLDGFDSDLRVAGAGQTQGSCSPGVRPTLTIEDLGTSKPTSCTEFCVAQIKVHKSCVNLISSTLLSRIIRSILCRIKPFNTRKISRMIRENIHLTPLLTCRCVCVLNVSLFQVEKVKSDLV